MAKAEIARIAGAVASRATSAVEVVEGALARARAAEPMRLFLDLDAEAALARARAVDARVEAGEVMPLAGVPVAMKDNILVRGETARCASRILEGYRSFYDAGVVERLVAAGAVPIGRANMDEFAMGSSGENSAFGPAANPWGESLVPGGSSSGSAAAVAARVVPASLGSDTGGSIRQPAAFCGIVGLKPTYGRVSRRGLVAFASSLDQIGPFGVCVDDVARIYEAIAGFDAGDATSVDRPVEPVTPAAERGLRGLRVGVPAEAFGEGLDPAVEAAVRESIARMEAEGAVIVPVALPHSRYAVATYYITACAEASSNLARFDGVRFGHRTPDPDSVRALYARTRAEGFGSEVRRRVVLGTYVLSAGYYNAYYRKAQQLRTLFIRDFAEAFAVCDVIASPTSPVPAFARGERVSDPLSMYLADVYTIPANLAGLPAMSLPCGTTPDGRPIGLHLVAPSWDEATLFGAAYAWERLAPELPLPPGAVNPTEAP